MVAITNTGEEISPNAGLKLIHILTAVGDSADTTTITLADYGLTNVYNVICQVHSTALSVIVTEAVTTSVTSGVLTVTLAASNDGKKRSILIVGN